MSWGFYILDENRCPVEVDNLTWGQWFNDRTKRRVNRTSVDGLLVSTVFLGIDHGFDDTMPPILFESMVFNDVGDFGDLYCARYHSWAEAEAGHARIVAQIARGDWVEELGANVTFDATADEAINHMTRVYCREHLNGAAMTLVADFGISKDIQRTLSVPWIVPVAWAVFDVESYTEATHAPDS